MNDRFAYSVIRYVGDPVRGEGANIGVIVISPDGDARVRTDPSAMSRLARFWPRFNRRAVRAFIRDIEHRVAALHQLRIEEAGPRDSGASVDVLAELSALAVNEVQLSQPAHYRSTTIEEATEALFKRFVSIPQKPQRKGRYMNRADLRKTIHGILAEWAASKSLEIESDTEVEGEFAPHKVDIVVRRDGGPDLIVLALPLRTRTAALIRDSLPTAVADLRAAHPDTRFLAVLPDLPDIEEGDPARTPDNLDTDRIRQFLSSSVKDLDVLSVSTLLDHLKMHYSASHAFSTVRQGELLETR